MIMKVRVHTTAAAPKLVPEPQVREIFTQIANGIAAKYPKLGKRMKKELPEFKFHKGGTNMGIRGRLRNEKKGARVHPADADDLILESQSGYGDNNTDKEDAIYFRYMVLEKQPEVKGLQISGKAKTVEGLVKVLLKQLDVKAASMKSVIHQYENAIKQLNDFL